MLSLFDKHHYEHHKKSFYSLNTAQSSLKQKRYDSAHQSASERKTQHGSTLSHTACIDRRVTCFHISFREQTFVSQIFGPGAGGVVEPVKTFLWSSLIIGQNSAVLSAGNCMSLSIITSCTNLPLTEISTGGERRLNFRQRSESVKILRLSGAVRRDRRALSIYRKVDAAAIISDYARITTLFVR